MTDTAPQSAVLMQRHEGTALLLKSRITVTHCLGIHLPAVEMGLDALGGDPFQLLFLLICQQEIIALLSPLPHDGEGMIAHHTVAPLRVDVARVLVEQMFHLITAVEHEHERHDAEQATGTRRQSLGAVRRIRLHGGDQLPHVAALDGLARHAVHADGILITGVVGKVATDHEEVVLVEIRPQHRGHLLQPTEVVGGDDDRHDGRYLTQLLLQEGQLHLQTVLLGVDILLEGEYLVGRYQRLGGLLIYWHVTQRCGIEVGLAIH